ncbi:MAG: efflux RND transporter periplasmic adaptor subunit [Rhodocyclaceae bacterium]|nr:efflux RND transporter periplasmic adaptor subunit [Rhodocyclaceae bacterium]
MKALPPSSASRRSAAALPFVFLLLAFGVLVGGCGEGKDRAAGSPAAGAPGQPAKPALTVTATTPEQMEWPRLLPAAGNVAAWQEAVIGAEVANYRLAEVRVNVGDPVRKGDLLARIADESLVADLAEAKAAAAEAQAVLEEAKANAERARELVAKRFYSIQQAGQYLTAEQTATARAEATRARVRAVELRLSYTRIVAPDDGVISARAATAGSLTVPGQELFRLIRGGRLEWRAEVTAAELVRIPPGAAAVLTSPTGSKVRGTVRISAPTVDPQTRNAIVYVDLPASAAGVLRAGMFARGEFELGRSPALTLPQGAVVLREGFAYVFRIDEGGKAAGDGPVRVVQSKVTVGRRAGERVEITGGLDAGAKVVATGAGFLADGDLVRWVVAP